jgi:hypothetical protein
VLQKDDGLPRGGAINVVARRFWPLRSATADEDAAARVPSHDFP